MNNIPPRSNIGCAHNLRERGQTKTIHNSSQNIVNYHKKNCIKRTPISPAPLKRVFYLSSIFFSSIFYGF